MKHWDLSVVNSWAAGDQNGAAAQNNENPIAVFSDHVLVFYDAKYYDPSYGTGAFDSLLDWEDDSIDGYGVQFNKFPDQYSADFLFWIGKQDTKVCWKFGNNDQEKKHEDHFSVIELPLGDRLLGCGVSPGNQSGR